MRIATRIVREWGYIVLGTVLLVSLFIAPQIVKWIAMPYGVFISIRWLVRWVLPRYQRAGIRGLAPHKTPWAP